MEAKDLFLKHVNDHYDEILTKVSMLCSRNKQGRGTRSAHTFDRDSFQDAIVRVYNAVERKGTLKDMSPTGIESYIIVAYFNIVVEKKRSAHVRKRDHNYTDDNIYEVWEEYLDRKLTQKEKISSDLFKDYATLYIMSKVEENFDDEHMTLFKRKHFGNVSYKQLKQEYPDIQKVRNKVLEVNQWLRENVTRDEVLQSFNDIYGDLLR